MNLILGLLLAGGAVGAVFYLGRLASRFAENKQWLHLGATLCAAIAVLCCAIALIST